ncbi:MAG: hypothetical protein KDK70_37290, partial [Myxococcales bacterium]|nr:hypothetical protein [Myxococcales bacterium]
MGRHRPDRGAGLAGIVALGVACSPPASLRRQLDRADDMQPILEAQGTPALLELYDHCDARDHEPWLVCRATTEELGRRAKARLDAQHRGYADRFDWASFGGWALRGTCDDARAAVEQAGALWQGLDHPEALGLDRARVAEQFRPHLASSLGYALEYTGAHADALVACGDGDGLAQLLEHFAATTVPRWV